MKIDFICSTMNSEPPLFLKKGYTPKSYKVINQYICYESDLNEKFKNFNEIGLSKSRNRGLLLSDGDICVIADNDVYYEQDVENKIINYFNLYPDADILTFMVRTPEGNLFKKYKKNFFWHNKLTISSVSSIEIAFKRNSIIGREISFDESFGLGSNFPTGEEYIFLNDALNKGLKIGFVPETIVFHPIESSGSNFKNTKLIIAKGAMIRRVFGRLGILICLYFSLRKYKKSDLSFKSFFTYICSGFYGLK